MYLLFGVIFLVLGVVSFALQRGAVLIITTVVGCMFGALYNKDVWEEEEVVEHTIQICLLFFTLTMQWDRPLGLKR